MEAWAPAENFAEERAVTSQDRGPKVRARRGRRMASQGLGTGAVADIDRSPRLYPNEFCLI